MSKDDHYTNSWDMYSHWMRQGAPCRGLKRFYKNPVEIRNPYTFLAGWFNHRDMEYLQRVKFQCNFEWELLTGSTFNYKEIIALEARDLKFSNNEIYKRVVHFGFMTELGT